MLINISDSLKVALDLEELTSESERRLWMISHLSLFLPYGKSNWRGQFYRRDLLKRLRHAVGDGQEQSSEGFQLGGQGVVE